jgi:hypothetical protein
LVTEKEGIEVGKPKLLPERRDSICKVILSALKKGFVIILNS